ncbi:hypothetical protein [Nocardioides insulae]|uniref:hypothetical protein n=1 Tax=Nocardioides insulae TaxID=394734 RepID=UPI000687D7DC|nr:hypothetical protein [Nocardioides insulae]
MSEEHTKDPLGLIRGGEGTITGTVVCGAVIAYGSDYAESVGWFAVAIIGTVVVYWLAHLHAITLGSALTHRHHPFVALRHGIRESWPILGASAVPLAVLVVATLLGADLRGAAWAAMGVTVALLVGYSYLAGVRSGLDLPGRLACAAAGAGLGLLVVLLKVGLH